MCESTGELPAEDAHKRAVRPASQSRSHRVERWLPFPAVTTLPAVTITLRRLLASACLFFAACAGAPPFDAKAVATEWAAYMQRDYVLRPGDRLAIRVDSEALRTAETAET